MSEVDVVTETVIARPRDVVAAYASNPENAPRGYENIEAIEWETPAPLRRGTRVAFVAHFLGRRLEYTYEVVDLSPDERLVAATKQGPFPMETTYTWETIDASSTRMTLRNRGRPSGFSAAMTPVISAMMKRTNWKDLARLKEILEGGQRGANIARSDT